MNQKSRFKVIIAESMAEDGINLLRYNPNFDVVVLDKKDSDKLKIEIKDADAIIVRSGVKIRKDLLELAQELKIVGRAGAGYDNIDVEECSKRGIVVMIAPAGNTNGVVELTIGLMFSLARHIPKADATMKNDIWAKKKLAGTELKGKVLGLIGLGKIGGRVAEISYALGMKVMALVRNPTKKRNISVPVDFVSSLEELLPKVDYLSLHLPLNEKTRGLIGEKELSMMKPSAFLINTSRGAITDENALYKALKDNKIKGAAVDVYSKEPVPQGEFPFIKLDNVIACPHLGASTKESQANVSRIICEHIMDALEKEIFIDAVNLPFSIPTNEASNYTPFLKLSKALAAIAGQYSSERVKKIQLHYRMQHHLDLSPIVMVLCASLLKYGDPNVSLINVKNCMEDKDISLEIFNEKDLSYNNSLRLYIEYNDDSNLEVKGTFIADVPKIVEIQKIRLEFIPTGNIIIIRNYNVPGAIGKIGTVLGNHKINIAEMHLGRSTIGGETKGAICVDEVVPEEVLEEIRSMKEVVGARMISFD